MKSTSGIFLYFFPEWEKEHVTRQKLLESPVASAFSDAIRNDRNFQEFVSFANVAVGPTGTSGVCVACVPNNWPNCHRIGYHPDEQTWVNCGTHWLGMAKHSRPTPLTLQREKLISGYELELGDGNVWFAPTVRKWSNDNETFGANVPMKMGIAPDGNFAAAVRSDVAWAWELACSFWDKRLTGGLTNGEYLNAATRFLSLNYRIGPHEAFALDLFDSENIVAVLEAALDVQAVELWLSEQDQKKSQSPAER